MTRWACHRWLTLRRNQVLAVLAMSNMTADELSKALFMAVKANNLSAVYGILKDGANVNARRKNTQETPLTWAVSSDEEKLSMVNLLIDHGADIDARTVSGSPALICAAIYGQTDIIDLLLNRGANVDIRDNAGNTPLHCAAYYGKLDVVNRMAGKLININAVNDRGWTPLMEASYGFRYTDCVGVVRQLLELGADFAIKDKEGKTALDIAEELDKPAIVNVLLEHQKAHQTHSALTDVIVHSSTQPQETLSF